MLNLAFFYIVRASNYTSYSVQTSIHLDVETLAMSPTKNHLEHSFQTFQHLVNENVNYEVKTTGATFCLLTGVETLSNMNESFKSIDSRVGGN